MQRGGKTLCCDAELITRQTLTEFSRIRELTPPKYIENAAHWEGHQGHATIHSKSHAASFQIVFFDPQLTV